MKKLLVMMLVAVVCLAFVACNSTEPAQNVDPAGETPTETTPVEETPVEGDTSIPVEEIKIGEKISTEFVEMSFDEVVVAKDIKHSVTVDNVTRITGPEPIEGQHYICLSGKIKNTGKTELPVFDFFIGNIDLDGYVYEVDANDCDILSGDGSSESKIAPLMEYDFRIYTAIPDALVDNYASGNFHFGFYDMFDNKELSKNRAFEENPVVLCPYQYKVTIK